MTISLNDLEGDGRLAAHPPSVYSAFSGPSPVKTKDGVFSNMVGASTSFTSTSSHPIPPRPPLYDEVASMRPPNYSIAAPAIFRLIHGSDQQQSTRPPSIADILIDGIPLGTWTSFFGPLAVVLVSQFVGFLLVLMIVRSHAGHHGAFAGLGLLLSIMAASGGLDNSSKGQVEIGLATSLDPFLLVSVIIVGLSLFFFSFYSYARIRSRASASMEELQGMENA